MSNKKRIKNNRIKINSLDDAREYIRGREKFYRERYGDALLCLSSSGSVLIEGVKKYRRQFFELARIYAQIEDPVYIGTIDNFLKDGKVERIVGTGYSKYLRGKYVGGNL